MAEITKVEGTQTVIKNLARVSGKLKAALERGLTKAGVHLQRASQAIVPVDIGNLKASAFTRREGSGRGTAVYVGYTASYAIYVHEDLEAAHGEDYNVKYAGDLKPGQKGYKQRGPNQQAKFLETPAREKRVELIAIVQSELESIS